MPRGLWLIGAAALVAIAISAASIVDAGVSDDGLRGAIRGTARLSLLLFLVTFAASSVNALFRSGASKWMLRNRKFLGNAFAASHAVHGLLVVGLVALDPARFLEHASAVGIYGGLFGYAVLAAMVITSFDGPAHRLGRRRWRVLHKGGIYILFAIFLFTYLPVALAGSLVGIAATFGLSIALGLRIAARLRTRAR